jgi:membrane associated rhomboid family serine protease
MVNESETEPEPRQAFFNRQPAIVLVLAGLIIAAHIGRALAPPELSAEIAQRFSVIPASYEEGLNATNLTALVGHIFIHADFIHLTFNMALFLAVSGAVVRRLGAAGGGALRFLVLFFVSGLVSAGFFIMLDPGSQIGAVGASGAICGLFAAYLMGARWDWRASLRDPQVRNAGIWFLALNVGLAFVVRQFNVLPIAWEAHLGGFLAGMVLFPFLAPKLATHREGA